MKAWKSEDFIQHHGIKGQRWGVRRTPEELGHKTARAGLHSGTRVAKSLGRDTIVQDAIRSGQVSTIVNREKQRRHTLLGHIPGRSYIHGDVDYAQQLIDELSGTGEAVIFGNDEWNHRERVIASKIIGTYVDPNNGAEIETNKAMIVYSKTGAHIYPRKER